MSQETETVRNVNIKVLLPLIERYGNLDIFHKDSKASKTTELDSSFEPIVLIQLLRSIPRSIEELSVSLTPDKLVKFVIHFMWLFNEGLKKLDSDSVDFSGTVNEFFDEVTELLELSLVENLKLDTLLDDLISSLMENIQKHLSDSSKSFSVNAQRLLSCFELLAEHDLLSPATSTKILNHLPMLMAKDFSFIKYHINVTWVGHQLTKAELNPESARKCLDALILLAKNGDLASPLSTSVINPLIQAMVRAGLRTEFYAQLIIDIHELVKGSTYRHQPLWPTADLNLELLLDSLLLTDTTNSFQIIAHSVARIAAIFGRINQNSIISEPIPLSKLETVLELGLGQRKEGAWCVHMSKLLFATVTLLEGAEDSSENASFKAKCKQIVAILNEPDHVGKLSFCDISRICLMLVKLSVSDTDLTTNMIEAVRHRLESGFKLHPSKFYGSVDQLKAYLCFIGEATPKLPVNKVGMPTITGLPTWIDQHRDPREVHSSRLVEDLLLLAKDKPWFNFEVVKPDYIVAWHGLTVLINNDSGEKFLIQFYDETTSYNYTRHSKRPSKADHFRDKYLLNLDDTDDKPIFKAVIPFKIYATNTLEECLVIFEKMIKELNSLEKNEITDEKKPKVQKKSTIGSPPRVPSFYEFSGSFISSIPRRGKSPDEEKKVIAYLPPTENKAPTDQKFFQDTGFALFQKGISYWRGTNCVPDEKMALGCILQSANYGYKTAIYYIGVFYELGIGVPPDPRKAKEYYTTAAHLGANWAKYRLIALDILSNAKKQYDIALNYLEGQNGAEKNWDLALIHLKHAARLNYQPAKELLKETVGIKHSHAATETCRNI